MHDVELDWLIKLRWGAITGQFVTILVAAYGFGVHVDVARLLPLVAIEALSNVAAWLYVRSGRPATVSLFASIMAFDVVVLTGLLWLSGGPSNPFSFLYLVHIALAAVALPPAATWALVAFSLVCSASLFIDHNPHAAHDMQMHVEGMWVAFIVSAVFIVYFLDRVSRALHHREEALRRTEKLAALATLAAGAAHELSTPLSTIAVVAKELERRADDASTAEDAQLIRSQVDRCQLILQQMSTDAGRTTGEVEETVDVDVLLDMATDALDGIERDGDLEGRRVACHPRALSQALHNLLDNAVAASDGAPVTLRVRGDAQSLCLEIEDRGTGMSEDVLARAGEPFFTTKEPGSGMGLGLFLARAVIERGGGALTLSSVDGRGTTAVVTLPVAR